jgi:CubicO group peptidase (beta-lactamase class C family)
MPKSTRALPRRWAPLLVIAVGCSAPTAAPPRPAPAVSVPVDVAKSDEAANMRQLDDAATRLARIERGLIPEVRVRGEARGWSLEERLRVHHTPGVSIAIIHDHRVVAARAYGVADTTTGERLTATTLMQAASVSKVFTAFAALKEVEAGKIPLEANVNGTLRSWKLPDDDFTRATPVTLKHVLSHTAGLNVPSTIQDGRRPTELEMLEGRPPAVTPPVRVGFAPGTKFRYSGGGPTIVQQMLIDVEKRPFPEVMDRLVLGPLGLAHSTYAIPMKSERWPSVAAAHDFDETVVRTTVVPWVGSAAGGLWSTPTDIARLLIEVQLGRLGRSKLVSKQMADHMTRPSFSTGQGEAIEIALGPFVEKHGAGRYFGHDGLGVGFITVARAGITNGDGAVIMANGQSSTPLVLEILRSVAAEYEWEGWLAPPIQPARVDPAQLAALAGRYGSSSSEPMRVAVKGEHLEARQPFREPLELLPLGPNDFVDRAEGVRFTFTTSASGVSVIQAPPPWPPSPGTVELTRAADAAPPEPLALLEAGRNAEALAEAKKRFAANPKDPAVAEGLFGRLGEDLLHRRLDPKRAIDVLQLGLELHPKAPMPRMVLAEALHRAGRRGEAATEVTKAKAHFARDTTMSEIARVFFLWRVSRVEALEATAK